MLWLIIGIAIFFGIHSVRMAAPGIRDGFIAKRGIGPWKGLYAVVSLVGLVILIWGFGIARQAAPILYSPPEWMRHVTLLLMWPAFILAVAAEVPVGRIKKAVMHPMILSVKIWAFAHLLANGDLASLVLFGSFLAYGVVNRIAVKRRGAPVFGTVSTKGDIIAVAGGTILYLVFLLWAHEWLFGVAPIA